MADFYPVLSKAIAGLADQSPKTRAAIYDRAKLVLLTQLSKMQPPLPEAEIARQQQALDEVIARIEREQAPSQSSPPASEPAREPALPDLPEPPPRQPAVASRPALATRPSPPAPPQDEAPAAETETPAPQGRPRLEISTGNTAGKARAVRNLIVAGVVALAVGLIAMTAVYVNREPTQQPSALSNPTRPAAPQAGGPKINERAGAEPPVAQAPAIPSATQPPRAEIAVAQRAVLYIEPADASQPPRGIQGRVSWRVEAQNAGQGQQLETVIRADTEIPDVGLSLVFTIRRNTDAAFPASHIVGMRFQRSADDGNGAVREAGVPQFKTEENERGAPLSAITSALGENLFVSALSRVPIEVERNVELIRSRNWIDIPVRFASGKRGIIAFEKGLSGDQRIAEGFRAWQ
jgi:hypothetical protein